MRFDSGKELIQKCEELKKSIAEITLMQEMEHYEATKEEIEKKIILMLNIMDKSSKEALSNPVPSLSGMIGGEAQKAWKYGKKDPMSGNFLMEAMAMALSTAEVNASMGRIVAAPTAGASGILPAALMALRNQMNLALKDLIPGFLTATGIGIIIGKHATFSGAEGGCQAECGSAAAMASAAIIALKGGSPRQCLDAASIALTNIMGLVCDSVAGLVEYPCALRNANGVVNSFTTADLVLAGITPLVSFDEVVEAMYKVGKSIPYTLRETGLGGVAASPTGCAIRKRVFEK